MSRGHASRVLRSLMLVGLVEASLVGGGVLSYACTQLGRRTAVDEAQDPSESG